MGKTASGEKIWLDPERTTPYAFYQYWLNTPDADAPRLLRTFSLLPLADIDKLLAQHESERSKRVAQRELARAMTAWVHGPEAIDTIESASSRLFSTELAELRDADLAQLAETAPTIDVPRAELAAGISIVDLFSRTFDESRKGARRLIAQGGGYLNNVKVDDIERVVTLQDLGTETMLVVRSGKKNYRLVRVV